MEFKRILKRRRRQGQHDHLDVTVQENVNFRAPNPPLLSNSGPTYRPLSRPPTSDAELQQKKPIRSKPGVAHVTSFSIPQNYGATNVWTGHRSNAGYSYAVSPHARMGNNPQYSNTYSRPWSQSNWHEDLPSLSQTRPPTIPFGAYVNPAFFPNIPGPSLSPNISDNLKRHMDILREINNHRRHQN
jgi:hypothetical protein